MKTPTRFRSDEGQVSLLLLAACIALLALGVAFFQVGFASELHGRARTAADAAALAGASAVERAWSQQVYNAAEAGDWARVTEVLSGTAVAPESPAQAAARDYAGRNDADLVFFSAELREVRVGVRTRAHYDGNMVKQDEVRGEAAAHARVVLRCTVVRGPASGWGPPHPTRPARLRCPGTPAVPLAKGSLPELRAADMFAVRLVG